MDKNKLRSYIESLMERGSSLSELARRADVSTTALSLFRTGNYTAKDDIMAEKIASGLHYYENSRKVVDTVTSYRQVKTAFVAARSKRKWLCADSRRSSGWNGSAGVWTKRSGQQQERRTGRVSGGLDDRRLGIWHCQER